MPPGVQEKETNSLLDALLHATRIDFMGHAVKLRRGEPRYFWTGEADGRIYRSCSQSGSLRVVDRKQGLRDELVRHAHDLQQIPLPQPEQIWASWQDPGLRVRVLRLRRSLVWGRVEVQVQHLRDNGHRVRYEWNVFVRLFIPPVGRISDVWARLLERDLL